MPGSYWIILQVKGSVGLITIGSTVLGRNGGGGNIIGQIWIYAGWLLVMFYFLHADAFVLLGTNFECLFGLLFEIMMSRPPLLLGFIAALASRPELIKSVACWTLIPIRQSGLRWIPQRASDIDTDEIPLHIQITPELLHLTKSHKLHSPNLEIFAIVHNPTKVVLSHSPNMLQQSHQVSKVHVLRHSIDRHLQ